MENEEDVLNMHAKGFSVNIGGKKLQLVFHPPFWNHLKKTFWYHRCSTVISSAQFFSPHRSFVDG